MWVRVPSGTQYKNKTLQINKMDINDIINEKRRRKLSILYKDYKNAWKIINDKRYEFDKYEKEYDTASVERKKEILNLSPKDEDYKKANSLMDTLHKELSKRELIDFFTKNGLLDGSSVMFDS